MVKCNLEQNTYVCHDTLCYSNASKPYIRNICPVVQGYYSWVLQYSVIHFNINSHVCMGTNPEQQDVYHDIDVCLHLNKKSIKILMHTHSLFQVTHILPCNWQNMCILHLCICTSVIWLAITTLSFDNHLPEDSHCIPKHVGVSYYPCFVNGVNFLFDIWWVVPGLQNGRYICKLLSLLLCICWNVYCVLV